MSAQAGSRSRWLRYGVIAALVVVLVVGIYLIWPGRTGHKVIGYFTSAVGLYPGDDVRIVGVPVGTIKSIEPQAEAVKITMEVKDGVKLPAERASGHHGAEHRFGALHPTDPRLHQRSGDGRRRSHRTGSHGRAGGVGRSQVGADQAQRIAWAAGWFDAGAPRRLRQPGRRHLRRQRRLLPSSAAGAVPDGGPVGRLPHRPVRHRQEPADPHQRTVQEQRADRSVQRPPFLGVAGARRQFDATSTTRSARSTRRCRTSADSFRTTTRH